jgi:hypothetical protein
LNSNLSDQPQRGFSRKSLAENLHKIGMALVNQVQRWQTDQWSFWPWKNLHIICLQFQRCAAQKFPSPLQTRKYFV